MAYVNTQYIAVLQIDQLTFIPQNNTPYPPNYAIFVNANGIAFWAISMDGVALSTFSTCVYTYYDKNHELLSTNISSIQTQIINQSTILEVRFADLIGLSTSYNSEVSTLYASTVYGLVQKFYLISTPTTFDDEFSGLNSSIQYGLSTLSTTIVTGSESTIQTTVNSINIYIASTISYIDSLLSTQSSIVAYESELSTFSSIVTKQLFSTSIGYQDINVSSVSSLTSSILGLTAGENRNASTTLSLQKQTADLELFSTTFSTTTYLWISSFTSTSQGIQDSYVYKSISSLSSLISYNRISTLSLYQTVSVTTFSTIRSLQVTNANVSTLGSQISTQTNQVSSLTGTALNLEIESTFLQLADYSYNLVYSTQSSITKFQISTSQVVFTQNMSVAVSYFRRYESTIYGSTLSTLIPFDKRYISTTMNSSTYLILYSTLVHNLLPIYSTASFNYDSTLQYNYYSTNIIWTSTSDSFLQLYESSLLFSTNAAYVAFVNDTTNASTLHIGYTAGSVLQGEYAVAIGNMAGSVNQGTSAIAIGNKAGVLNQNPNSIILNATSDTVNNPTTAGFFAKPIRFYNLIPQSFVCYNSTTGELVTNNNIITDSNASKIIYLEENFMIAAGGAGASYRVASSFDGMTWTALVNPPNLSDCLGIAYNGNWIAVGTSSTSISSDGKRWKVTTWGVSYSLFPTEDFAFSCVAWNGSVWILGRTVFPGTVITNVLGYLFYSVDGANWLPCLGDVFYGPTSSVRAIAWNGVMSIAVGSSMSYSYDGINWIAVTQAYLTTCTAIAWNGTMWVVVGDSGIIYSYDGINWTIANALIALFTSVAWNGSIWIAGCTVNNPSLFFSQDGINWNPSVTHLNNVVNPIVLWNQSFWLSGNQSGSDLEYSYDGINWISINGTLFLGGLTSFANAAFLPNTGINPFSVNSFQNSSTIHMGTNSGFAQEGHTIAVGFSAGTSSQGAYSVALGNNVGTVRQHPYSILLNAGAQGLEATQNAGLYVKPVRNFDNGSQTIVFDYVRKTFAIAGYGNLAYNGARKEVVYSFDYDIQYKYVAGGNVMGYSTDGIHWVAAPVTPTPTILQCRSILFSGTTLVMGGRFDSNCFAYSANGKQWTRYGNTFVTCTGIARNSNVWVACGLGGANPLVHSADGTNWFGSPSGNSLTNPTCIGWNGSLWVAGGSGSQTLLYSADGIVWTPGTSFGLAVVTSLGWNSDIWVAGLSSGLYALAFSTDGIQWYGSASGSIFTSCASVGWNGSIWVAGGQGSTRLAYSYDGITWTASSSGNSIFGTSCTSVQWGFSLWMAGGTGGNTVAYSVDGIQWFASASGSSLFSSCQSFGVLSSAAPANPFAKLSTIQIGYQAGQSFQGEYSIAIGNQAATNHQNPSSIVLNALPNRLENSTLSGFFVQPIRQEEEVVNQPLFYRTNSKEIIYSLGTNKSNRYFLGGTGLNELFYSLDEQTWNASYNGNALVTACYAIVVLGELIVAGGAGSNRLLYSANGVSWTPSASGNSVFSVRCSAIVTTGSLWVAGGNDALGYSLDGINWIPSATTLFVGGNCYAVATNQSIWIAGGSGTSLNNQMAVSTDGITWSNTNAPDSALTEVRTIVYNQSLWLAGGLSGSNPCIAYSYNGTDWVATAITSMQLLECYALAWNGSQWVAGGTISGGGAIVYSTDGINWTTSISGTSIFTVSCRSLIWEGTRWLAGGNGTNQLAYSTNGTTWIPLASTPFGAGGLCSAIGFGSFSIPNNDFSDSSTLRIGYQAGLSSQGNYAIAIGNKAGTTNQNPSSIILNASPNGLENSTLSGFFANPVRPDATNGNAGLAYNVATKEVVHSYGINIYSSTIQIGQFAGNVNQGEYAIAIGYRAGQNYQYPSSIMLHAGPNALENSTFSGFFVNPIRANTGGNDPLLYYNVDTKEIFNSPTALNTYSSTIKIGYNAGFTNQGEYAIAIGNQAGTTNQYPGSIVLNASSIALENSALAGFFVQPIRGDSTIGTLPIQYNPLTKEIVAGYSSGKNPILVGGGSAAPLAYSYDGIQWTSSPSGTLFQDSYAAVWNTGFWLAGGSQLGGNGFALANSQDGINWTYVATMGLTTCWSLAWNGEVWVAAGESGASMYWSYDGANWSVTNANTFLSAAYAVVWIGETFVAGGQGPLLVSQNGQSWSSVPTVQTIVRALSFSDGIVVAGGSGTNVLSYSLTGGQTWIAAPTGDTCFTTCQAVANNGSMWVAAGVGSFALAYSYDGIHWTGSPSGNSVFSTGLSVLWNGTIWIAGGTGFYTAANSGDGIVWGPCASGASLFFPTGFSGLGIGPFVGLNGFSSTIQIGYNAGLTNQGEYAIAIGNQAGTTDQYPSSIILNATSGNLENSTFSGFVVKPVRNVQGGGNVGLFYNTDTKEIAYNPAGLNLYSSSIQIGYQAGLSSQGNYAIAIGNQAGTILQQANTIILNANSQPLENNDVFLYQLIAGGSSGLFENTNTVFVPIQSIQDQINYLLDTAYTPKLFKIVACGNVATYFSNDSGANWVPTAVVHITPSIYFPEGLTILQNTGPIAYGNGIWAASVTLPDQPIPIGFSGKQMMYSNDGFTWNADQIIFQDGGPPATIIFDTCYCVQFCDTFFLAGGNTCLVSSYPVFISTDGVLWIPDTNGSAIFSGTLNAVAYGNGILLGYGTTNTTTEVFAVLESGTWQIVPGYGGNIMFFGNGLFVLYDLVQGMIYSTDGQNWNLCVGTDGFVASALTYGTEVWIAIGTFPPSLNPQVLKSLDGITWYNAGFTMPDTLILGSVLVTRRMGATFVSPLRYSKNYSLFLNHNEETKEIVCSDNIVPPLLTTTWLAGGLMNTEYTVAYSTDGQTWTPIPFPIQYPVTFASNGKLVVSGGFGALKTDPCLAYSEDGIQWTLIPNDTRVYNMSAIATNGTFWVSGGEIGYLPPFPTPIQYSYDGKIWQVNTLQNITYLPTKIYVIATNGSQWLAGGPSVPYTQPAISYSADGIHWESTGDSANFQVCRAITTDGSFWVAGGEGPNSIMYSDGLLYDHWFASDSANTLMYVCLALAYNGSIWLAGGLGQSPILYSSDGKNWTAANNSGDVFETCTSFSWDSVHQLWVATGSTYNSLAYSNDGINWTPSPSGLSCMIFGTGSIAAFVFIKRFNSYGDTIQLGYEAGSIQQSKYAIAIGNQAGKTSQARSIILNASSEPLENSTIQGLFVQPIRFENAGSPMRYNSTTKEIVRGAENPFSPLFQTVVGGTNADTLLSTDYYGTFHGFGTTFFSVACTCVVYSGTTIVAGGQGGNSLIYSVDNGQQWSVSDSGNTIFGSGSYTVKAVAYGNGQFIAVGTGSGGVILAKSVDGNNWIIQDVSALGFIELTGVAYGSGKWVIIGYGSSALTSIALSTDNAASWSTTLNYINIDDVELGATRWDALQFGNGLFIVGGTQDTTPDPPFLVNPTPLYYSTDGYLWTAVLFSSGTGQFGYCYLLLWNGSMWIAAGKFKAFFQTQTSTNGVIWEFGSNDPIPFEKGIIVWSGTYWIRSYVSDSSTWYSYDGIDWTAGGDPNFTLANVSLYFQKGIRHSNPYSSTIQLGFQSGSTNQGLYSIAIGNQAGTTDQYPSSIILNATSTNLENTTVAGFFVNPIRYEEYATYPGLQYNFLTKEIAYNTPGGSISVFLSVAVGNLSSGSISLLYSRNGTTWNNCIALGSPLGNQINAVASAGPDYNGSFWVAGGSADFVYGNQLLYSSDGIHWQSSASGISAFSPHNCLCVAYGSSSIWLAGGTGGIIARSVDGIGWLVTGFSLFTDVFAIVYTGTHWIAGGNYGYPVYSTDGGYTWTDPALTLFFTNCYELTYGNGITLAGGSPNTGSESMLVSLDYGLTWTTVDSANTLFSGQPCTAIAYNGSTWLAGGASGMLLSSQDTVTWTIIATLGGSSIQSLSWNGLLWILGETNGLLYSSDGQTWTSSSSALAPCYGVASGNPPSQYRTNYFSGSSNITIGGDAGATNQGANAIAIGYQAGTTNQHASSIVLNATGGPLETTASGLFVAPIQSTLMKAYASLQYNSSALEITHYTPEAITVFFTVGGGNNSGQQLGYTTDGVHWNLSPTGSAFLPTLVNAVVYSSSLQLWVAGGSDVVSTNQVVYSNDGINWLPTTGVPTTFSCYGFASSETGRLVAIGQIAGSPSTAGLLYSDDGISWTDNSALVPLESTSQIRAIVFGSKYVIGGSGFVLAYSLNNGISWTQSGSSVLTSCAALSWGNGVFVAGGTGTNQLAYSTDGQTWTNADPVFNVAANCTAVAFNGSYFLATSDYTGSFAKSTDGNNWTIQSPFTSGSIVSLGWNNRYWIMSVIGPGSPTGVYYSANGINWTQSSSGSSLFTSGVNGFGSGQPYGYIRSNAFTNPIKIGFNAGISSIGTDYIAIGDQPAYTPPPPPSPPPPTPGGNFTVAGGEGMNALAYSSDGGLTWTSSASGTAIFGGGCFGVASNGISWVAAGSGSKAIAYSADGTTWYPGTIVLPNYSFGNGACVAWIEDYWYVGGAFFGSSMSIPDGFCARSSDGITWTVAPSSIYGSFPGCVTLAGGNGLILAGGLEGIAYSYDGKIWTLSAFTNACAAISYNGVLWLAGGGSHLWSSTDGFNWTQNAGTFGSGGAGIQGIAWNGSLWTMGLAGMAGDTVMYSSDGFIWTPSPYSIGPIQVGNGKTIFPNLCSSVTWNGTYWIAGGGGGSNQMAYSVDAITWTASSSSSAIFNTCRAVGSTYLVPLLPSVNTQTGVIQLGFQAGHSNQGTYAIAIGYQAGTTNQHPNSIVLNATGTPLESDRQGLRIAPIRSTVTGTQMLYYNTDTKEVVKDIFSFSSTIRIGLGAGANNQGLYAIAIGNQAGSSNQFTSSIVFNANPNPLQAGAAGLFVQPIRPYANGVVQALQYNREQEVIQMPNQIVGNRTVGGGEGTNSLGYSEDGGLTWNPSATGTAILSICYGVAYNGSKWVAVGQGVASCPIVYSTDGINWSSANVYFTDGVCRCIVWSGTQWIAGGQFNTTLDPEFFSWFAYSNDGEYWMTNPDSTLSQCYTIAYGNGVYVAGGVGTNSMVYSTDGSTWLPSNNLFLSGCSAVAWNGSLWVAGGGSDPNSSFMIYSNNATNWIVVPLNWVGITMINGFAWNGSLWVMAMGGINEQGTTAFSRDGIHWTQSGQTVLYYCTSVTWNGYYFVVGGDIGSSIAYSTDGITWFLSTSAGSVFTTACRSVASGAPVFTIHPNSYSSTIQIGFQAGMTNQGSYAIAIGNKAGTTDQYGGSIILNAGASPLENSATAGLFVNPIRNDVSLGGTTRVHYNPATNEVTYGGEPSDQRVKSKIQDANLSLCFSTIRDLPLRYFEWNDAFFKEQQGRDKHTLGFVAQEVLPYFPKSVNVLSNAHLPDLHTLEPDQMYKAHIGATKQLLAIVQARHSTIQSLVQKLERPAV